MMLSTSNRELLAIEFETVLMPEINESVAVFSCALCKFKIVMRSYADLSKSMTFLAIG